jgi:hypothetical protein
VILLLVGAVEFPSSPWIGTRAVGIWTVAVLAIHAIINAFPRPPQRDPDLRARAGHSGAGAHCRAGALGATKDSAEAHAQSADRWRM